jgi:hypothetical protein
MTDEAASLIHIRQLAVQFRHAIERCHTRLPIQFRDFPLGSCGDAALLLAKFLEKNGHPGFVYIVGMREGGSHAWLQQDNLTVDIAADQFSDQPQSVIVALNSDWHKTFERDHEDIADFEQYNRAAATELRNAYRLCIAHLER